MKEFDEDLEECGIEELYGGGPAVAVSPTEPTPRPKRNGDLEYIADSPEYLTYTIDNTGWREKLEETFQEAIARVRS